jgi:hypothetical protein
MAVAMFGCGRGTPTPPGTGAKEAAQGYFHALIQQDWPKAYAALDPPSRGRCSPDQFARLAWTYRSNLGFEPSAVQVWACEERGAEATAHVGLTGRAATKDRRYKDAITLRRMDDGWRVVLPPNFGQTMKR